MILSTIIDKNSGCGGGAANTGKLGCKIEFSTPLHFIGLLAGTVIPANTDFNKAYIQGLIQAGTAIPLIGADAFEPMHAEDAVNTNTAGIERVTLKGLPKYKVTYQEGSAFYKELAKLTTFKNLDFIIGDSEGNWKMVLLSNGDFKGFRAGQVNALMTSDRTQGGESENKPLTIQFLSRLEWDKNYGIVTRANVDFDPEDITGVNGVKLTFNEAPANLDTTLKIVAKLASDNNTLVTGLVTANFLVKVDGATVVATAVEASGVYTLTLPALATADVVTVDLYDSVANKDIVLSGDILYRSETITATVIA